MDDVKFGRAGLQFSQLCLGCMTYGVSGLGAQATPPDG